MVYEIYKGETHYWCSFKYLWNIGGKQEKAAITWTSTFFEFPPVFQSRTVLLVLNLKSSGINTNTVCNYNKEKFTQLTDQLMRSINLVIYFMGKISVLRKTPSVHFIHWCILFIYFIYTIWKRHQNDIIMLSWDSDPRSRTLSGKEVCLTGSYLMMVPQGLL